ncbi:hypothetical protein L5470_10315 [Synechococcus sp. PCC 6717]|jgi:hypothetical protein|uniref:Uncharacterized protein n=1 Tax=Parathermosynechococcus lividus PCC 6715 TaxID=1917166 RepID=A0A2D2PZH5_PARLV|nr:hypothetical protein [Thermostichus lividus]ATS17650.1 hypothetical protein BRW62_01585 [Thermostichus lividus PCC 6715]MCI3281363.1 hypothetical protein [Synechococcus sp. PCC 6717]
MGLIENLETAIGASRRNYAELLSLTSELITERQQRGQHSWRSLSSQPWTAAKLQKAFPSFQAARAYFYQRYGIKAKGWQTLAERVNTVEAALVHLGLAIRETPEARAIAPLCGS